MYNLKKKYGDWALVTGASSGIGEEFARVLASEHINLILTARRIEKLNTLADTLQKEYPVNIITVKADLSDDNFINDIISFTSGLNVGILINNAGAGTFTEFDKSNFDKVLKMLRLNCAAPVILTHHFIQKMAGNKKGAVIFVGSIAGALPNPYMSVYSASKAFNNVLGPALWYDQKHNNIDILTIAPGGTRTEFHEKADIKKGPFIRSSKNVVHTAFRTLGKKPFVVDGFINKSMYVLSRILPMKMLMILAGGFSQKRKKV